MLHISFKPVARSKLFFLVQRKDCTGILYVDTETVKLGFDGGRIATVSRSGRVLWEDGDG